MSLIDRDGNPIAPESYTLDLDHDYQGSARSPPPPFSRTPPSLIPYTSGPREARRLWPAFGKPVEIAKDILLSAAGADESDLEAASFSRAAARCDALGFAAAGVLEKEQRIGDLLTAVMGEFMGSWWKNARGQIKLVMDLGPGSLVESEIVHVFRPEHLKNISVEADIDDLVNQVSLFYAYNPALDEFEALLDEQDLRDQKSIGLFGRKPRNSN